MLSSRWFTAIAVIFFVGSLMYLFIAHSGTHSALKPNSMLNCFSRGQRMDETCMQKVINTLLATYQPRELMHYITATTSPELVRLNCHTEAHDIGQETFKQSPSMESALSKCTNECNFGCWHGVIVASVAQDLGEQSAENLAHADISEIKKTGTEYCSQSFPACHVIGHAAYINLSDIQKSLRLCDSVGTNTAASSCYLGVYMEAFQNSFASSSSTYTDDHAHADDLTYPCDSISAQYQHACFLYLPGAKKYSHLISDTTYPQRVAMWHKACNSLPNYKMRSDCYMGMGMLYERYIDADGNLSGNNGTQCNHLSGTDLDSCIVGVSTVYAYFDDHRKALSFCYSLEDSREKSLCYNAAFQALAKYSQSHADVASKCDGLAYQEECHTELARYQQVAKSLPDYYSLGLF